MSVKKLKALVFFLAATALIAAGKEPVVAIIDFDFEDLEKKKAHLFAEKVGSHLASNELLNVIVHSEIKTVLQEVGMAEGPCQTDECLVQAGRMMDISHVVMGKVTKRGSMLAAEARVLIMETGKKEMVRSVVCWRCQEEDLILKMAVNLSGRISATIQDNSEMKNNLNRASKYTGDRKGSGSIWKSKWTYIGIGTLATGTVATYFLLNQSKDSSSEPIAGAPPP